MKFPYILLFSCVATFIACSDDSSTTSAPITKETKYDCSTEEGVVVAYPAGGETFKLGDTITVVYGADSSLAGPFFSFKLRENEDDVGTELTDEAVGEENPDGKTCYEQKVWLDPELLSASEEAFIQVVPYVKTKLLGKSGKFTITE